MIASVKDVRDLCGLPEASKLPDHKIQPHLEASARKLKEQIGDYSDATGDKKDAVRDAECCLCMANLLPILNTLFPEDLTTAQKVMGDMDFKFNSPRAVKELVLYWKSRAEGCIQEYKNEEDEWVAI